VTDFLGDPKAEVASDVDTYAVHTRLIAESLYTAEYSPMYHREDKPSPATIHFQCSTVLCTSGEQYGGSRP